MVKLNYAFKNGNLSLRISEKKERYYKSVKSLLLGNPNIAKHWDESKQRFTNYGHKNEVYNVSMVL